MTVVGDTFVVYVAKTFIRKMTNAHIVMQGLKEQKGYRYGDNVR